MKPITVAYQDEKFSEPITYTFDLMLTIIGIVCNIRPYSELPAHVIDSELLISYGHDKPDTKVKHYIHIYQSKLFGESYLASSSMPNIPLKCWRELPIIYEGLSTLGNFIARSDSSIETNIDLIASSFFMLSRYEEIVVDAKDQYDRFPARASIAYKENFLTRPIVNEYIDLLWEWIDSFDIGFKRKSAMWDGKDFAVLLTHDVDEIQKYRWWCPPLKSIARTIKHGQFSRTLCYIWDWIASSLKIKPDPYWTFDYITKQEHKFGFKSSFYFMTGGNTKYDCHIYRYAINNPKVITLIKRLETMGHEIGLHGSFNSFNDYGIFVNEKAKLNQIVSNRQYGGRQHYLRWKTPDTWRILEKAGMLYDATLGYGDHEGFRSGICFPYKPFDVIESREINIWQLPLVVMDRSLYGYQNLSLEGAFQRIKKLVDVVKRYNGVFVLLIHNSFFYELQALGISGFYEKVLAYMAKQRAFNNTAQEIINRWQNYIAISPNAGMERM